MRSFLKRNTFLIGTSYVPYWCLFKRSGRSLTALAPAWAGGGVHPPAPQEGGFLCRPLLPPWRGRRMLGDERVKSVNP